MLEHPTQDHPSAARSIWALGDYHAFAKATVWSLGPVLVEACGVERGSHVLDVAAGSGNVAIRAAAAGGRVVASDLDGAAFEAGRAEARAMGVELDWVEADAQDLPFADGRFDVVTSSFGVMFAPDHERAASEMVRVCRRPGGTIGLVSFTPAGLGAEFFATLAPYLPAAPDGAGSPLDWGSETHVRSLFGPRVEWLQLERRTYVEHAPSPTDYAALFSRTFGPAIAAGEAARPALADFAVRANSGAPGGPAAYEFEYLLAVARTL